MKASATILFFSLPLLAADPAVVLSRYSPPALSRVVREWEPVKASLNGRSLELVWNEPAPGTLTARNGDLAFRIQYEGFQNPNALRWTVAVTNTGSQPVRGLKLLPLAFRLDVDPKHDFPRVRHVSGSNHYDGTYPPRAYRVSEELIATHDHCKPIELGNGAGSADRDVPVAQFSVGGRSRAGLTVGFEWSGNWDLRFAWERTSFEGQPRPPFLITGNPGLGTLAVAAGESISLPRVHLVFSRDAAGWDAFSNDFRRYLLDHVVPGLAGHPAMPPVSYDHWFGIHQGFDLADMKRQATRAAELGVEYFCLDAAWYRGKHWGEGIGNWFTPDPGRFPTGDAGVRELSAHVRNLGMKFGMWHQLENARSGTDFPSRYPTLFQYNGTPSPLRLDLAEGRAAALERLRYWCGEWNVRWMRWELGGAQWLYKVDPSGKLALNYLAGLYEVIDTIRQEYPDLYIEGCDGGGRRFDLGIVARTHGTWLSDHTADADVSRFNQTGALRIWPAQYLNMAVRVHRNTADAEATSHSLISRMAGALSFNGDIAQWTPAAAALARKHVAAYKEFRDALAGPVSFPLEQPRSDREWDAVVFGHESGKQVLMAFRKEGPGRVFLEGIPGRGNWKLALGGEGARIEATAGGHFVYLNPGSSAVWRR